MAGHADFLRAQDPRWLLTKPPKFDNSTSTCAALVFCRVSSIGHRLGLRSRHLLAHEGIVPLLRCSIERSYPVRRLTMKIVVIGGTGLIGTKLVQDLRQQGHEVVAAAPSTGVNTITGEGRAEALVAAQVVVNVANAPSWQDKAVLEFFESSGRDLLAAEAAAGVRHHVALSVVGTAPWSLRVFCVVGIKYIYIMGPDSKKDHVCRQGTFPRIDIPGMGSIRRAQCLDASSRTVIPQQHRLSATNPDRRNLTAAEVGRQSARLACALRPPRPPLWEIAQSKLRSDQFATSGAFH